MSPVVRRLFTVFAVVGGILGLVVGVAVGVLLNATDDAPGSPARTTIIELPATTTSSTSTTTDAPIASP